jgi:hypothetical protein
MSKFVCLAALAAALSFSGTAGASTVPAAPVVSDNSVLELNPQPLPPRDKFRASIFSIKRR